MSWLAQMLMTEVRPQMSAEDRHPEIRNERSGPKDMTHVNAARVKKAEGRYREVMGNRWMKTRDIENAMGHQRGASYKWLMEKVEQGIMEKTHVGAFYNRSRGWQWRFK